MRREYVLFLMGVLLLLAVGCEPLADKPLNVAAWATGQDRQATGRLGLVRGNGEVGVSGSYEGGISRRWDVGLYTVIRMPEPIEVPNPLPGFGETIQGVAFAGLDIIWDQENHKTDIGVMPGVLISAPAAEDAYAPQVVLAYRDVAELFCIGLRAQF